MSDNTEIELIGTALQNFDRVSAGLALLEKNFKGVLYDVETSMGMEHAKAARSQIREPRYEVERLRKGAKAPLLALGKRLDAEATRITNALLTLETPIDDQIKGEENRKEQERVAKAAAEALRLSQIHRAIEGIRHWAVTAVNKPSAAVEQILATANDYQATAEIFQERLAEAQEALLISRAALSGIHAERQAYETEQERVKAERIELARLRTEQAERDRLTREAQAAENAKQAEILRQARAENDRIAAERQAEFDRQAKDQREAQAAEAARIATDRAELERLQKVVRPVTESQKTNKGMPTRGEILNVLAKHYSIQVKTVEKWMSMIDWEMVS